MDLRKKLARLGSAGPGSRPRGTGEAGEPADAGEAGEPSFLAPDPAASSKEARVARLRGLVNDVIARQKKRLRDDAKKPPPPIDDLPGETRETEHGPLHVIDTWLEPHHCHGKVPIARALEVDPRVVARLALDPSLEEVDLRRMLLVDTETTGLQGGTGTLPFLVGMAWFEDESLRVQQLFLRRPGEEAPILAALRERLAWASCLVSYNGKSFDWPLLRTRFVMNRVASPAPPPHLDLLHSARRIYKPRLPNVRLVSLEMEVLGLFRERDVDGAEIPGIYLDFLKGRPCGRLGTVIEHNANDLVALAAVLARLTHHFAELATDDDPRDHLGYAKVAARAKDHARALEFARAAAEGGGDRAVTVEAYLLAARVARRTKEVDAEEEALLRAVEAASVHAVEALAAEAHLALAKLYEHKKKNLERALAHAAQTVPAETEDESRHRVARLAARLP
jgi:uncharacterized protein YprB with RNaseH-like and TPR domain